MKRLKTLLFLLPAFGLFLASSLPQAQAHSSSRYHCHWRNGVKYCHGHKYKRHCWHDSYGRRHCRYY